jgi:hypothetical protein
VTVPELREEEFESRWEAAPAVTLLIASQLTLALISEKQSWKVWDLPWWVWLIPVVPEVVLLLPLALDRPRRRLEQMGLRRMFALTLLGVINAANAFLVCAVVASLVQGTERSGSQLLLKAGTVWISNVVAFGLSFWEIDRGGPVRRLQGRERPPDFQFPQMENPELAPRGWQPQFLDYLYVAFTNAIAFSPTDAMPLTHRAKALMLAESAASAVTILLVAARAVNIFQ